MEQLIHEGEQMPLPAAAPWLFQITSPSQLMDQMVHMLLEDDIL
jgi:hypothetical protein